MFSATKNEVIILAETDEQWLYNWKQETATLAILCAILAYIIRQAASTIKGIQHPSLVCRQVSYI